MYEIYLIKKLIAINVIHIFFYLLIKIKFFSVNHCGFCINIGVNKISNNYTKYLK